MISREGCSDDLQDIRFASTKRSPTVYADEEDKREKNRILLLQTKDELKKEVNEVNGQIKKAQELVKETEKRAQTERMKEEVKQIEIHLQQAEEKHADYNERILMLFELFAILA